MADKDLATLTLATVLASTDELSGNQSGAAKNFALSLLDARWRRYAVAEQTGTSYELVLTDEGGLIQCNNASAITLTVPSNATAALPIGSRVRIQATGAGTVTITAAGGVTLRDPSTLAAISTQYASAELVKVAENEWLIIP